MSLRLIARLAAASLAVLGCGDTFEVGDQSTGDGGMGGGFGAGGDGGYPNDADGVSTPEIVSDPAAGGGPSGLQPAVCLLEPTELLIAGEQSLGLASGQYFESVLRATRAAPKGATHAALTTYLENRAELAEATPSVSLTSTGEKGRYVVQSTGRISKVPAVESVLHVVAVVDVSPSNGSIEQTRDRFLDGLADGVDADGKGKLSLVSFSESATVILDGVASGDARSALDLVRTDLATSEGEDLSEALKVAGGLTSQDDVTHIVVLTDGGFLPSEEARLLTSQLANDRRRVSVAQLSNVGSLDAVPELRLGLLGGIATPGRGVTLFMDASREVQFETWFNRPIASAGPAEFRLSLPPGIVLAETDVAANDVEKTPVVNGQMAVSLTATVTDECELETQAGTSAGMLSVALGESHGFIEVGSPQGAGISATPDQDDEVLSAAVARLDILIKGGTCADVAFESPSSCDESSLPTNDCARAAAINTMIDEACAEAP